MLEIVLPFVYHYNKMGKRIASKRIKTIGISYSAIYISTIMEPVTKAFSDD